MKPTVSKPTITKGESNKYQDDLVEVIDGDGSKPLKKADDKKFSKNNSKENLKTKPINQKSTKKITPVPSTNENIKKSPKKPNEKKTVKLAEKSQNDYSESEDQAEKEYSARKNNNKKQIEDDYDDDYDNEKQVLQPIIPQPHSAISQNNPNIKVAEEFYSNSNPPNPQFVYQFPPNQFYPQQFPLQFNNFMMPPNPMFYPNQFVGQPFGYDNRFDGANNMNKNQNPYENGLERSDKKNNYNESRQESTKEPDSEIKNYIKEQEEFLQKLENDRKKLKDKLNNEQKPAEKPKPSHHSQPLQENIPSRSNEVYPPQNNRNQEQSKQRELDPKSDQKQKNRGRDERDELAELQRKTDELLEKFMNPADKGGSRSPPRNQYGYNNYHQESQNNYEDEEQEDDIEEYEESQTTPQKSDKKKFKSHGSSPISELNYSISEKDRVIKFDYG